MQFSRCREPLPVASSAPCPDPREVSHALEGGERGSVCTLTFVGHKHYLMSAVVNHDGQWVVSGSRDRSVLFWDARNAQAQFALHGHSNWVNSVDASPTGDIFATGDRDGTTRICELIAAYNLELSIDCSQGNTNV